MVLPDNGTFRVCELGFYFTLPFTWSNLLNRTINDIVKAYD